eukprot:TRINITY_DN3555_c0_g1_i1.p1 TRINITY_DN3555_c0_g1~~TRINITY_DN3555_c0_g1_i1.p1  ORF type:complete len:472 (+),score=70.18 TRINITY_DN3555_c0_g1_i1:339-1754(+)
MYCEAMRMIPGNEHFRGRIEYTSIVKHYFGSRMFKASQIGLNGALQSLNIISVIQSVQVMDQAISAIWGKSCGFNLTPFSLSGETYNGTMPESTHFWTCIDANDTGDGNAWGCHCIISVGFIICILITIPIGRWNLDDNMVIQVGAFILTILCWVVWFIASCWSENFHSYNDWQIPAVTDSSYDYSSQAGVLGTILFNFGFVTTIPSWVNEKQPQVNINNSVWISTWLCNLIFFWLGISGCMAFQQFLAGPATNNCAGVDGMSDVSCGQSILSIFTSPDLLKFYLPGIHNSGAANFIVQLSVYLFPIAAVLSSIPVFSIVVKYNCIENGWNQSFSFLWGVVFPWVISIPLLYQPGALNQFISYTSLIFVSFTDFIVPFLLYFRLQRDNTEETIQEDNEALISGDLEEDPEDYLTYGNIHWALSPKLGFSRKAKSITAIVLVVVMAAVAVAGTVTSIQTSATNTWDCANVGN